MSVISGLPAHPLLVHFVVVLAPLTATLLIVCAVWPAARQRLVWLVAALAGIVLVLTPITVEAGEWLYERTPDSSWLDTHEHLGETMIYVALALAVAAALVTFVHVRAARGKTSTALSVVVAVVVIIIGAGATVQVFRIGDSGARSVWNDAVNADVAEEAG